MNDLFQGISEGEFDQRFGSQEKCLEFLARVKWGDRPFVCRKCDNTHYCQGKSSFSRRCTRCKREESATAHTFFHHCRIPLTEAFRIVFLVCNKPAISSYQLSRTIHSRQMTCWKFKRKVEECLEHGFPISMPGSNDG